MSCESSFERSRRLNVTDFTRESIPDSGGSIRKRTFQTCSDVGYAKNSWIRGGMKLSRKRVDRGCGSEEGMAEC